MGINGSGLRKQVTAERNSAIDSAAESFTQRGSKQTDIPIDMLIEAPFEVDDPNELAIFQNSKALDTDFDYLLTRI